MTRMPGTWRSAVKRGSLLIEYAALIVMLVAALLGMSIYIKRAIEGRWRQVGDTFGNGRQYEPGLTVVR